MKSTRFRSFAAFVVIAVLGIASERPALAEPAEEGPWATVTETDRAIKIETDLIEAVIPKKDPVHWMTGIEKQSFLDKKTGFREIGDGLMVIDWLMEAGSDAAWAEEVFAPGRPRRGAVPLVRGSGRSADARVRACGTRNDPPEAGGGGTATLPSDETGRAGSYPRQGFRRRENNLPL